MCLLEEGLWPSRPCRNRWGSPLAYVTVTHSLDHWVVMDFPSNTGLAARLHTAIRQTEGTLVISRINLAVFPRVVILLLLPVGATACLFYRRDKERLVAVPSAAVRLMQLAKAGTAEELPSILADGADVNRP